jgi:FkbM family methyltransferase
MLISTAHPAITPQVKAMLFWNVYESAEIRFVQRYLKPDLDVVELGSSLGVMACQIRARLQSDRKLICVEANPPLALVIQQHLALNGFEDNTTVVVGAIDYSGGDTTHFITGENSLQGRKTHGVKGTTQTPAFTLEQLLKEHSMQDYALVCDIEGAEAGIIFQGGEALKGCRQIVIELHEIVLDSRPVSVDEMIDELVMHRGFHLRDRYGTVCVFDRETYP